MICILKYSITGKSLVLVVGRQKFYGSCKNLADFELGEKEQIIFRKWKDIKEALEQKKASSIELQARGGH